MYVPLVGIGTLPAPLSPACVPLPPEPKGEAHTRLRLRGWGSPNSNDWRKSLALCHSKSQLIHTQCLLYRASDCQCRTRNSPGFYPSILRHGGI